jgi:hypothetical protein
MGGDQAVRRQNTRGRSRDGAESPAVEGEVTRLREKNLAHKKKTLELTGFFCRVLVCHVAHKE